MRLTLFAERATLEATAVLENNGGVCHVLRHDVESACA